MTAAKKPTSPCVKVCVIDQARGLCRGCGRTLDEIASWGGLSEDARRTVMDALPARMAAFSKGASA